MERMERHVKQQHGETGGGWKELTRDQVVSIIISDQTVSGGGVLPDYKCFYCMHTGTIPGLKEHTNTAHVGRVLRVVRFHAQRVSGYLECQLCGHLSPGFEKNHQKTHFHEEHPLESEVVCSKYTSKARPAETVSSSQQTFKFDVN